MFGLPSTIIIFDTEYTTWEGALKRHWNGPGEHRELVHLGAIRVDMTKPCETDSFEIFVKPRVNPILSSFFVELTGITQNIIDLKGVDFSVAWKSFIKWSRKDAAYSFGNDGEVLKENCMLASIPYHEDARFHDICAVFEKYGVHTNRYHSSTIVRAFGKEPRIGAHNALNDARSILDGLVLLLKKINGLTFK